MGDLTLKPTIKMHNCYILLPPGVAQPTMQRRYFKNGSLCNTNPPQNYKIKIIQRDNTNERRISLLKCYIIKQKSYGFSQ